MIVAIDEKIKTRLTSWCVATSQPPELFVNEAVGKSLDDWEDYIDALSICREIDAGHMKVYSLDEVERQLDELNALDC